MSKSLFFFPVACLLLFCSDPKKNVNLHFSEDNGGIVLPEGFKAVVVADSVGRSRHLAINDNGDIYVMLSFQKNGKGIAALRDTNNDGKADITEYFGDLTGTGIEIYKGYLYHSTPTAIYRYKLTAGQLIPSSGPELVVGGFIQQNQHNSKPFTFDKKENMYVTVGGPSNACQEKARTAGSAGLDPCPQLEKQGGIWRFSATKTGQTQDAGGYRYATGIRNAVAIFWNQTVDILYAVQHGRDQLSQLWPDYYDDEDNAELPSEEFLMVNDGSDFGWPYSYYDHIQGKKLLSPEYGGNGKKEKMDPNFEDPIVAFPGHYGPNDLIFYTADQFPAKYKDGAFIAFHGSWNRYPFEQKGYLVAFVPFSKERPSGDWEIFADGFKGVEKLEHSGQAKYRPCGLAQGPDGSLYISDSQKGKLWKVVYTGE
jgi:glucose/arabinose dehydrogenase